jgi:membrane-associated phospholipid phosphatase
MTRGAKPLLIGAGACAGLFALLFAVRYTSPWARDVDASALLGFYRFDRPGVHQLAEWVGHLGGAKAVVAMALGLSAVALARSRPRVAVAVLALVGATSVSSQVLKALLAHPSYDGAVAGKPIDPAAFPSGHSTAAMTLALAGVLVAPRGLRPLAAFVGAGFALAVAYSVIALGWHFPSDAVGGFLLATGWTLLVAACLRAMAARWPEGTVRSRGAAAIREVVDGVAAVGLATAAIAGVVLAGLIVAALLLTRLPQVLGYADTHTAFVVVATAVAVSAAALLGAVTLALRRR